MSYNTGVTTPPSSSRWITFDDGEVILVPPGEDVVRLIMDVGIMSHFASTPGGDLTVDILFSVEPDKDK